MANFLQKPLYHPTNLEFTYSGHHISSFLHFDWINEMLTETVRILDQSKPNLLATYSYYQKPTNSTYTLSNVGATQIKLKIAKCCTNSHNPTPPA